MAIKPGIDNADIVGRSFVVNIYKDKFPMHSWKEDFIIFPVWM